MQVCRLSPGFGSSQTQLPAWQAARQPEDAPDDHLPKVVGVAGRGPQPGADELALILGVRLEHGLLPVSHRLERQARRVQRDACPVPVGQLASWCLGE